LAAVIKALAPINKGLMNGCSLVDKSLLGRSVKDGIIENSIFRDFQSICRLYLSSQKNPWITGAEGVLIVLNTMELLCLPNFTSKGMVSWVMFPKDKGRSFIISICTGL
jgi:hypothetical protein